MTKGLLSLVFRWFREPLVCAARHTIGRALWRPESKARSQHELDSVDRRTQLFLAIEPASILA